MPIDYLAGDPVPAQPHEIKIGPGGFYLLKDGSGPYYYDGAGLLYPVSGSSGGGGGGESGPSAYPGETRLFALEPGQTVPAGWVADSSMDLQRPYRQNLIGLFQGYGASAGWAPSTPIVFGDELFFKGVGTASSSNLLSFTRGGEYVRNILTGTPGAPQQWPERPVLVNSKLVLFGGYSPYNYLNIIDAASGSIIRQGSTSFRAFQGHSFCRLNDSEILVVGGSSSSANFLTDGVEIHAVNIETYTIRKLSASLQKAVSNPILCRLPSGNLFIGGGLDAHMPSALGSPPTGSIIVGAYYLFNTETENLVGPFDIPLQHLPKRGGKSWSCRNSTGIFYENDSIISSSTPQAPPLISKFSKFIESTGVFEFTDIPFVYPQSAGQSSHENDSDYSDLGFYFITSNSANTGVQVAFKNSFESKRLVYAVKI